MSYSVTGTQKVCHSAQEQEHFKIQRPIRLALSIGIRRNRKTGFHDHDLCWQAALSCAYRPGVAQATWGARAPASSSQNVRNYFGQQGRAVLCRPGDEKFGFSVFSTSTDHNSARREIQDARASWRNLRPDDRGGT